MTPEKLLTHLESLGIALTADEGKLRVSAAPGALSPELKALVVEAKAGLLTVLASRDLAHSAHITPLEPTEPRRASAFQQRLWILQRIDRAATTYNVARVWWSMGMQGADEVALAVHSLLERHDILRSRFEEHDDAVFAVAGATQSTPVEVRDLVSLEPSEQRARIRADFDLQLRKAFDLVAAPPARFFVYRLGPGSSALVLIAHHIAVDDWSLTLIGQELGAEAGVPRTLARPALQFHDFAAWQRRSNDAALLGPEIDWWSANLAGAPALSSFPTDRHDVSDEGGATVTVDWDGIFTKRLKATARGEGATVFISMIAACAVVLRWHTGQTDAVFGVPMGVRDRTECESMIGPFVNLLLVRVDISGNPTFAQLLHRTRDAMLEAHAHRHVPFESILERVQPARNVERSPLFQIALVQHQSSGSAQENSLQGGGGSMHELTWYLRETQAGMECTFEYRPDLYSRELIERVARHLELVLRRGSENSHLHLKELCTPSEAERRGLIDTLNATAFDFRGADFISAFESHSASSPDRIAIRYADSGMTYGELNSRANQLAHHLRALGAGRGMTVAIVLPREPALMVALLAVLKSGAAYLPVDPQFPPERIAFMLEDAAAAILLTSGSLPSKLVPRDSTAVIDVAAASIAALPRTNSESGARPEDAAYVIYTSGSTGRPKGVVIARSSLNNLLASTAREPGISADDVLAAVTTISFDIAGLELYLPLFVGASVDLVPREVSADGRRLMQYLSTRPITMLQATPATWRLLIETGWAGDNRLRALCGGEALPRDLAEGLIERVGQLWNMYGPTETTIWSTVERVERERAITIGRPIANTQIYILGAEHELLPFGVAGEIWIGGAGVALGYHARPELTAERFVADSFGANTAGKIYRTGDLGRWAGDGRLEHLGRMDHQVKIRGFRIELGEIEAALLTMPEIERAVALAIDAGVADRRLVAYIAFKADEDLTASDVRRHLRQSLPEYMIPSLVVPVDAIPLTPNGKVDRNALPDPFGGVAVNREFAVPSEGMEKLIAQIWSDVLKVERIGANDNFFDLGGHSLLSLRVAAAVQQKSGWPMDPRILFFNSLRQIAVVAESGNADSRQRA